MNTLPVSAGGEPRRDALRATRTASAGERTRAEHLRASAAAAVRRYPGSGRADGDKTAPPAGRGGQRRTRPAGGRPGRTRRPTARRTVRWSAKGPGPAVPRSGAPAAERGAAERRATDPCALAADIHVHDRHRLTAVVGGCAVLDTAQGSRPVRPGDILVLPAGMPHRLVARGEAALQLLAVEFTSGAELTAVEQPLLERVFDGRPVIHCSPAAAVEAQSLLHRIRAEQRRDKVVGAVAVRAYLLSLLVLLYRRRRPKSVAGRLAATEPLVRQAMRYMQSHYAEPLRVADLAARAHLSPRQFTARFKRAFGQTPIRYLTGLRVATAQDLLSTSSKGVDEIAREVGYESVSHFYRTFERYAGMPPGRYRSSAPEPAPAPG